MKKRLRFELPHTPLKVLRGEPDEVDIQDKYHERFQAPDTTTEDAEDDKDTDDYSRTSSLSNYDMATDIDAASDIAEVSEGGFARYLGGSLDTVNDATDAHEYINLETANVKVAAQVHHLPDADVTSYENPPNIPGYPPGVPEYDTTRSVNIEAADVQVVAQVHHLPDSDETSNDSLSNDDAAPLLDNVQWLRYWLLTNGWPK